MIIVLLISIISISILLIFYYLLLMGPWPRKSNFHIDFMTVKELAKVHEKELPTGINISVIATGELPSWGVVAGDFCGDNSKIEFPSFQLVYENKTAIIEAPYNKRLFDKFPFGKEFYQDEYEIMQKALLEADFILPTHEHWDHLGAIAQSSNINILLPKTILTKEQIDGPTISDAEFPEHIFNGYKPLEYSKYHRVAPGVVLIKAPGHSVGHQFIYVILQNGSEFLFTGDVVWVNKNIKKQKNRPWLASKKRLENRKQIAHQMRYLHDEFHLNKAQQINMLTTHDPEEHKQYIEKGLIGNGFQMKSEL